MPRASGLGQDDWFGEALLITLGADRGALSAVG